MTQKNFKVYKSSAGSGKTFTLSKTFLKLVLFNLEPDYFKHILAITFTVKAAAEMKERIVSYLSAIAGNPSSRKDSEFMKVQLAIETGLPEAEITVRAKAALQSLIHNYGDFSILTIDKFVHRLVRSFASDLGMSPDFEVEIDQSRLVALVTNALLEKVGQDESLTRLILAYTENQTEVDKSWNIEPELASLAEQLSSEDFFLHGDGLRNIRYHNALEIIQTLKAEVSNFEKDVLAIYEKSEKILADNGLNYTDFKYAASGFHSYFNKFSDLDTYLENRLPSERAQDLASADDSASPKSPNKNVANDVMPLYNSLLLEAISLADKAAEIKLKKNLQTELFSIALINELRELFVKIKEEENVQTLSDFNQVITENFFGEQTPYIYEKLGNRYHHILIDEFQDTSTLQWINLLPLVENSLASGNESLIVGDAKQSIYRFRGSEPKQFIQLPKVANDASPLFESSYDGRVLNTNYRSARNIVLFNNRFFKHFAANLLSEHHLHVYDDLAQGINSDKNGEVFFHLIDKEKEEKKAEVLYESMLERIFELKEKDEKSLGKTCVLFRANDAASSFAALLLKNNIDVISEESLLIANSAAVQTIISTLYAARYSNDMFYQQSLLAKLTQFRLINAPHHKLASELKEQKLDFNGLMKLAELPLRLAELEQGDSFHKIYRLCQIYGFDFKSPYVLRLLDFAWDFEQGNLYLKHSFLDYFENQKSKLSVQLPTTGNAVRVMTIHKSKGLEFEHVLIYLPDLSNSKPTKKFTLVHDEKTVHSMNDFILPIEKLKGTPHEKIYVEENEKSGLDFLNTVYVAFTRAELTLDIFTLNKPSKSKKQPFEFILDWEEFNEKLNKLELTGSLPNDWDKN